MSVSAPNLDVVFRELEKRLEREPDEITGEIVLGVYLMSPRPRPRHSSTEGRLFAALQRRFGEAGPGGEPPDWLFLVEPEIRSERAFSRLVPDVAGWRKSTTGWPDPDVTPVTLVPDWVAEVLSPSTAKTDRTLKREAYGAMGVGWLWLLDTDGRRVETFANVRGQMIAGLVFETGDALTGEPFGDTPVPVRELFL
jgi:Uma2 family endonuclease